MQRVNVTRVVWALAATGALTAAVVAGLLAERRAPTDDLPAGLPSARASSSERDGGTCGNDAVGELADARAILRATVDAVEEPQAYWRDNASEHERHVEALVTSSAQARAGLIDAYGTAVIDEPALRWLFYPLERRFPFFGSEQQIAVHEAELRSSALAASRADAVPHVDAFERHLLDLAEQIGETAAFEYALRASPLAAQIRASGVELSEPEFRDVYSLLAPSARGGLSQADYHDIRRALRELLGSQRFAALWAARDPRFSELAQVGARYGLSDDAVMSAYLVLNDSQDALLAATLRASGDARSDAARLRELYDDSRARLADVVGEEGARAISSALSLSSRAPSAGPLP